MSYCLVLCLAWCNQADTLKEWLEHEAITKSLRLSELVVWTLCHIITIWWGWLNQISCICKTCFHSLNLIVCLCHDSSYCKILIIFHSNVILFFKANKKIMQKFFQFSMTLWQACAQARKNYACRWRCWNVITAASHWDASTRQV